MKGRHKGDALWAMRAHLIMDYSFRTKTTLWPRLGPRAPRTMCGNDGTVLACVFNHFMPELVSLLRKVFEA